MHARQAKGSGAGIQDLINGVVDFAASDAAMKDDEMAQVGQGVVLLPMTIASMIGSYLFFAQHSYEDMRILAEEDWTYHKAAMESSSYMKLNRIMRWFTGNIGFHHIHHLNVRIPFYRLPEAMKAIPELQSPATTTLSLGGSGVTLPAPAALIARKLEDPEANLKDWDHLTDFIHHKLLLADGQPVPGYAGSEVMVCGQ